MMRPTALDLLNGSRALSCASSLTPPMTRSPSTKRRGAGCDGRRPTGQDGERLWPRPAVARAGSDDHVGEADRPAPLEEGVRVPSSEPSGEHGSSATSPSSAMAFAPGVQLGRGVRPFSAVRS